MESVKVPGDARFVENPNDYALYRDCKQKQQSRWKTSPASPFAANSL